MKNKPNKQKPGQDKRVIKKIPVKKKDDAGIPFYYVAILLAVTCIAFYPCISNGFTGWDEQPYIVNNPLIKHLSMENTKRIFSEVYLANYQPLHLFSYMVEYHFFGLKASGYHWVSLLMHLVNVLLVLWFTKIISKNNYISFFTALLFAVTPLRVESVAWAAERKDLLYSMFFFAALISYLFYLRGNRNRKYLVYTFLFFILSVFSKTMAVSLVPVLFLLDYFNNRKFSGKVILEKIPFIVIAFVMGIISVKASSAAESIDANSYFSFTDRIFFACQNLLMYAGKLILPVNLSSYYAYPFLENGHIPLSYYISGIGVIILAILVLWSMKKGKLIFFCTGYFVSTVALVLMLIPVGPTIFSERYSYVPSVMFYFLILFYLFNYVAKQNSKQSKIVTSVVLVACSLIFVQITRQRCTIWKDGITLWSDVLKNDDKNPHAYNNRGFEYKLLNENGLAISDLNNAIKLKQDYPEPYSSLCDIYGSMGKFDSALYFANKALAIKPDMPQALNNRGILRAMRNNPDSALMDFNHAIQVQPDMYEAYTNRGILFRSKGNIDAALQDFDRSIMLNPDFAKAFQQKEITLKNKK